METVFQAVRFLRLPAIAADAYNSYYRYWCETLEVVLTAECSSAFNLILTPHTVKLMYSPNVGTGGGGGELVYDMFRDGRLKRSECSDSSTSSINLASTVRGAALRPLTTFRGHRRYLMLLSSTPTSTCQVCVVRKSRRLHIGDATQIGSAKITKHTCSVSPRTPALPETR